MPIAMPRTLLALICVSALLAAASQAPAATEALDRWSYSCTVTYLDSNDRPQIDTVTGHVAAEDQEKAENAAWLEAWNKYGTKTLSVLVTECEKVENRTGLAAGPRSARGQ